jgi:hypothetical protein
VRHPLRRHGGACRNAFAKIGANSVLRCLGGFFAERAERPLAARGVAPKEKRAVSRHGEQNLGSGLGGVRKASILGAFGSGAGAALAHESADEKTNGTAAMPGLIAHAGEAANGAVFTWDALSAAAKIAEEVIKAHGKCVGAPRATQGPSAAMLPRFSTWLRGSVRGPAMPLCRTKGLQPCAGSPSGEKPWLQGIIS